VCTNAKQTTYLSLGLLLIGERLLQHGVNGADVEALGSILRNFLGLN
jgi:hypothetical protein